MLRPRTVRVPAARLWRATSIVAAPAVVALAALGLHAGAAPGLVLGAMAAVLVVLALLVRRHLARLEAWRQQIDALAADSASSTSPPHGDLGDALAALARRWAHHGGELQALLAANDSILEAIPDPLVLVDSQCRVARVNAAGRALLGDGVAGRALDSVLRHPDVLTAADEYLAGQPSVASVDLLWPGPPERHFSVHFARLAPAESADGPAILLVLHDETALKRAERMRADFVANVSHELRTPLSALLGFVETLRGPARDDTAARERFLGIMHDQAQRMTRLVRDLLSLSRIEQSEHTPPTDRIDLGRVIGSVLDAVSLQAKAKSLKVDVDLASALPAVVGDGDQLAQVFQNLLDNAIKYGQANGRVRVVARGTPTAPPRIARAGGEDAVREWVSVAVADDGEGIAREHLSRLTERFYRVDPARSRQLGGTGLGLAIVKHILNRHRGGLTIDSEPGHGAVFTVWLPAAIPQQATATPQGFVTAAQSAKPAPADKRH